MTKFVVYNFPNRKNYGFTEFYQKAELMRDKLDTVSPSICLAKWLQVSINLTNGTTQSCYHPPPHVIPITELKRDVGALHNTAHKKQERKLMLSGKRPEGCNYCWRVEDAGQGNHLSDRHYKSSEWWAVDQFDDVTGKDHSYKVLPKYVEVNFNRTCNFKCMYCSPHISTTWQEEIEQFGPYKVLDYVHNDLSFLKKDGFMPLEVANKDNPYVEAFWKWWPNLYPGLRVFRMTGGEPLLDKNTFKVLDYVIEHPNNKLELSITSNLCPTDQKLYDKFINKVKQIETVKQLVDKDTFPGKEFLYYDKGVKHFWLYVSFDSVGAQAEYIRTGLEFDRMVENIKTFLRETRFSTISFINTFNLLSIPGLKGYLQLILDLRTEFGGAGQIEEFILPELNPIEKFYSLKPKGFQKKKFQRIYFDIPLLNYPNWLDVRNATPDLINMTKECLEFMKNNEQDKNYLTTFQGFKPHEILKLERNISIMEESFNNNTLRTNRKQFYEWIQQYDKRRNLNFRETFPEMARFYGQCKNLSRSIYA